MRRRTFFKSGLLPLAALLAGPPRATGQTQRPNILWISAEDISPDLGCYGDAYANTPHIDAFAKTAVRYDRAYSHSGVCAPSRSGIITGMYPTAIGTHHMRCSGVPPAGVKCFSEYLRAAGYYCTNNKKTDYQFSVPRSAWDESSHQAHWRNRPEGQPFFSVMNFTVCHESQVRSRDPQRLAEIEALGDRRHDPDRATIPPYHADTPATRHDWAQYHDVISLMDLQVGETLTQLEEDGLSEDTIVWFWGDHGRGLTRGKRWLYESGTRIPLLIHVPEKWRGWVREQAPETLAHGTRDDMVCFVDFAPTVLSLAGAFLPDHLQGQAFLGAAEAAPRDYIYGARDRMDEAYDLIRTVRDKRFRYFRNYMPYVTYAQDIDYMNEMPMLQDLRRLHREGKLTADQAKWFAPRKPLEELYDVEADPHELKNLAGDPAFHADLRRLRAAHERWMNVSDDVGLIPEPELDRWRERNGVLTVQPPIILPTREGIVLRPSTPGASVSYRWADDPEKVWRLHAGPIAVRSGTKLHIMSTRIGFNDSDELVYDGNLELPQKRVVTQHPVDAEELALPLERVRALRALDFQANESVSTYLENLSADQAPLRYWAVVLLHRLVDSAMHDEAWTDAVRPLLEDPSNVVRVAAAHALSDWGEDDVALPTLTAVLAGGSQSERLYAVTALSQLGHVAEPAISALRAAQKDKWPYVRNVAGQALSRLEDEG